MIIRTTIDSIRKNKDFFGPGYTHIGMITACYALQLGQKTYERMIHVIHEYRIMAYIRDEMLMHQLSPSTFDYETAIARADKYGVGVYGFNGDQPELEGQKPLFKRGPQM